tara:strand:+ start:1222 stop:1458 length:237 start_codon:yes stop_codon:yes gene_type:complete
MRDIDKVIKSATRHLDTDTTKHVHIRGLRRIIAESLKRAVFERDTEAMEFAIRRLHRLGVNRGVIEQMITDAAMGGDV